ncbi:MAG TPA: SRPBCC family protein [Solirubrobacteraceae bacterium]|nr:SRPBCC family protein [Solirubrobacteraceae bacterium]
MNTQSVAAPVQASIVVQAPIERAFAVFTTGIGSWWPEKNHILQAELAEMVFEPRVGGHIYDVGTDGSESHWARILAYEPPERVVFSWDISTDWQLEPDPSRTSEIEVRFIAESPQRTRVELEHRGIERHGPGWEGMRAAVGSGWNGGLEAFAARIAS